MNGKCVKDQKKGKKRFKTVVLPYDAKLHAVYDNAELKSSLHMAYKEKKRLENAGN